MPTFPPRNSPGDYRCKFTIVQPTNAADGHGQQTTNQTTTVATVWGKITVYRGIVQSMAGGVLPEQISYIEMRYRPGILKNMVIIQTNITPNRSFRILENGDQGGRHEKLVLKVVELA